MEKNQKMQAQLQSKKMRGCIVLQRRFAPIGNAIALELKNSFGVEEFCGYVITRRAFDIINSQKDVKYTSLLLDEDLHNQYEEEKLDIDYLKKLEAEYGLPNLWPYIAIDRTLMMDIPKNEYSVSPAPPYTHEEMLRILQVKFREIIKFLKQEKPDFIVGINVSCIGNAILYYVAQKMGIKSYTIENGKIGNRITFSDDCKTLSGVEKIFKNIRKNDYQSPNRKEAEEFLAKFRENPVPPSFAIEEAEKSLVKKITSLPFKLTRAAVFTLKSTLKYLKTAHKSDIAMENPARALLNKFRRKIRGLRNLGPLYDKSDLSEDFAYFPLHFEPEITTLLYAPFYTNQINLLTQIAKSLPVHFKLYVKEHPSMLEYRPTEYYRELKKIPNLKLLNPKEKSLELIANAKIITTIAGTAGFEAAMLEKPVITFGDIFYNNLSSVKRCGPIENLPDLVKSQLENFQYDNQEIIDFLSAIFEDTMAYDLSNIWGGGTPDQIEGMKSDSGFQKFVSTLAKKLNLDK